MKKGDLLDLVGGLGAYPRNSTAMYSVFRQRSGTTTYVGPFGRNRVGVSGRYQERTRELLLVSKNPRSRRNRRRHRGRNRPTPKFTQTSFSPARVCRSLRQQYEETILK